MYGPQYDAGDMADFYPATEPRELLKKIEVLKAKIKHLDTFIDLLKTAIPIWYSK